MEGDAVQHLPAMKGNQTIGENLQGLPWYTPSPKRKKKIDNSANQNKKPAVAKKESKKHLVKQTITSQLAQKNPQSKIPDLEIKIENIIPGSPVYIPYKKPKVVGKGNNSKKIKLPNTNVMF